MYEEMGPDYDHCMKRTIQKVTSKYILGTPITSKGKAPVDNCNFKSFHENNIFTNTVKIHICDIQNF